MSRSLMEFTKQIEGGDFVDAASSTDLGRINAPSNGSQSNMQIVDEVETEPWNIEEAEPLIFLMQ